jgi:hypothetical protein
VNQRFIPIQNKAQMKKTSVVLILVSCLLSLHFSCQNKGKASGDQPSDGEQLARAYCGSCHVFPEPALLDKKTWEIGVLPVMAELMKPAKDGTAGPDSSIYGQTPPPTETISPEQWNQIVQYYTSNAPDILAPAKDSLESVQIGMPQFKAFPFYGRFSSPVTTLVYIDTVARKIYFGDGNAGKVFVTNSSFAITDSFITNPGATDVHPGKSTAVVSIGFITPSDLPRGRLENVTSKQDPVPIIGNLRRPVQAVYEDLNQDGREDIIIAEFGFREGGLSWYEQDEQKGYIKHILRNLPGASRVSVHDFNRDGKPDIAVLMAQGDEGVFIYYNEGAGTFKEEKVIGFPPVYGSNYFQLFDFNGDGFMDILTTQGDNADYSIVFKPYHGIRIFLNDGQNHFTQKIFLPLNGAQKAMPADFDRDGDIDLVSISFNPNYERSPEESFLLWENTGNNRYKRHSFSGYADGRWLTMDAGDMDGDGDQDIILGSALLPVGQVPPPLIEDWQRKRVSITILENLIVKK